MRGVLIAAAIATAAFAATCTNVFAATVQFPKNSAVAFTVQVPAGWTTSDDGKGNLTLSAAGQPLGDPNYSSGEAGADVPMTEVADADEEENPGLNDTSDWSDLFFESILADIGGFLFPDCDGFVAADGIGMSKKQWDAAIDSADGTTFRQTMNYPGTNSPHGCGSNSQYSVAWSVTRFTVIGSLRQFMSDHGLVPDPGLRSLA